MIKQMNRITAAILIGLFSFSNALFADEGQLISMVKELQNQMRTMQQTIDMQNAKISRLENSGGGVHIPAPVSEGEDPAKKRADFEKNLSKSIGDSDKWLKDLKFSGDLRLRYEAFDYSAGETDPRNRFRYRLRYGFEKKFSPEMKVGFAMASGEASSGANVDPTSTNTTFDNNFNFKHIFIERAYGTYTPEWAKIGPVEKFEVTGGKFKNPFETGSSDMIWDRDVRPEGAYEQVNFRLYDGENLKVPGYFTAGQFILDEDATLGSGTTGGDSELYAYQLGINPKFNTPLFEKPVSWLSAASFYDFSEYAQKSNFGTLARGNPNVTGSATELDAVDFNIFEVYNELAFQPEGIPQIALFSDWATNTANGATDASLGQHDNAWALGINLGKAKNKGEWELGYAYKYIAPNSVVGGFNDSDFGNGHSDKRGSVIKGKYMLTDSLELGLAAIFVNNVSADVILADEEVRRFQVDLAWKF